MASSAVKSGSLISLQDLHPSSPFFKQGLHSELLERYAVETASAIIVDGSVRLKVNTHHLRDLNFRVNSIYQFIGELHIQPDNEPILHAQVGRLVDGLDLNLYHQSLQLLRQFQADHMSDQSRS